MLELENWEIAPKFLGGVPDVAPGPSAGKIVAGDFPLDQVVIDELPSGTVVLSCNRYGGSEWTFAARIDTTFANGEPRSYFFKVSEGLQCWNSCSELEPANNLIHRFLVRRI